MAFCIYCGTGLKEGVKFCPKCGHSNNGSSPQISDKEKVQKSNKKSIYAFITIMSVILNIVFVAVLYSDIKEKNQADLIRQKKEMLIPIEIVLDIYKTKNRDFTKKLLEEYGYTYFVDDEDYEYFSKDVQLKVETDWRGYVHFEPTQRKGSKAMVSKVSEDFLIKVFSEKDYLEWIKQLKNLGYKENNYDEKLPEEDGWTILGAHGNLFKLYQDGKGNSVEFMKDGDGYIGYSVFDVNFSN